MVHVRRDRLISAFETRSNHVFDKARGLRGERREEKQTASIRTRVSITGSYTTRLSGSCYRPVAQIEQRQSSRKAAGICVSHMKGPLILFAIVAGMFWRLVFTRQYTWLNSPDVAGLVLPWFQLQAASLHRWSLVLWDPYQWCGHPIAAQGQAGVLYPLNWLLWAMPLHRTWYPARLSELVFRSDPFSGRIVRLLAMPGSGSAPEPLRFWAAWLLHSGRFWD